ncbi:MAG: hypothetical protein OJF61_001940 [Rhodanobacteraceae bacterium]|nr:MAG: hypothetical protein OJF61_001940 [Rhodanobacteraceae bacterium]
MATLMEFMADRHVAAECPQCGQDNWARAPMTPETKSIDNAVGVGLPMIDDRSVLSVHSYIPMLALLCLNCGYLRQFAWGVVEDWKKERAQNDQ